MESALPDVLQETFDVQVDGDTYTFKIPSIKYRFEMGGKSADIRRRGYPEGAMNERMGIIDGWSDTFSRECAIFELYLVRATTTWPYGSESVEQVDVAKPAVVDFEKFPSGREDTIAAVAAKFSEELARFRARRNTTG